MKRFFTFALLFQFFFSIAQNWPAERWSSATNLTAALGTSSVTDFSGLHWNPISNRLYGVQDNGVVRVLQWDSNTNTFSQIANKSISGGPEGITQANLYANEFYTVDETNYEIRRYTHNANFSNLSLYKHWNLLLSPMTDTGNTGPEGIVFIPDAILRAKEFISEQTGLKYTSTKGLGGLFFIASQEGGNIWVYDVNPNSNDDFIFVGKYKTNQSESCDLSVDRSTGLLYILHNISAHNKLEVTDLSSALDNGNQRKFVVKNEYIVADPEDTNDNIEGFAIVPKCPGFENVSAWLCRDVKSSESNAIQQDVLRWFHAFQAEGSCSSLTNIDFEFETVDLFPNPAHNLMTISTKKGRILTIQLYNNLGQQILKMEGIDRDSTSIDVSKLQSGIYFLSITKAEAIITTKFQKN